MTRSNWDLKRLVEQHSKVFFFLAALFNGVTCAQAATTTITNQPPSHAGWEASQDVRLPMREANSRIFRAAITFTATASNNVQMAFGKDVDGDGKLPDEETSAIVGWAMGSWFLQSGDLRTVYTNTPPNGGASASRTLRMSVRLDASGNPLALTFQDQSGSVVNFFGLTGIPQWVSPKEWDTTALTARGWDVRDEAAQISFVLDGTQIILR